MKTEKKIDKQILMILCAGVLLRLFYVWGTTVFERQYDIGTIAIDKGHIVSGGHLAYIQYLYETFRLPDFDPTTVYQFNHPPLHHYVSAVVMKICSLFIHDYADLYETLQIVPFICSVLIMWYCYRIFRMIFQKREALSVSMLLVAFHPALILLSGSVNNDTMSLLFMILCVYTMMQWCEQKTYRNIVKAALAIALGMMSKQSVAIMAFPMGTVFVCEWLRSIYAKDKSLTVKLSLEYVAFAVISVPLGMWFYIRNMILYHMPLVWVYTLSEDTWQYTGNVPVCNRFLWPVPEDILDNVRHLQMGCGYNVWMQIMRTGIVGEWDMSAVGREIKVVAMLLMLLGAALALFAFYCLIRCCAKLKWQVRILFIMGYVVNLIFYLKFAYDYPFQCSMSFRYIEIELLFTIGAIGLWRSESDSRMMNRLLSVTTGVFCMLSVILTGVWSFM